MVNENNNTYQRTIEMKVPDVKSNTYINFNIERIDKGPQFAVGNHVIISKYRNIVTKCYTKNCS